MDDWEREYEEDRRRMAAGGDVGGRRKVADDDPFQEQSSSGGYQPPTMVQDDARRIPDGATEGGGGSKASEDAKIEALYAQYRDDNSTGSTNNPQSGTAHQAASVDPSNGDTRIGLPYVCMPRTFEGKFGEKIGKALFFCESVKAFFKGFFSPNEAPMVCFVTARGIYLGDEKTGELVLARSIPLLKELHILGDLSIGLRGTDKTVDWFVTMPSNRQQFVAAITKLAAFHGVPLSTRTVSSEGEKSFKKEIRYVDRKEASWTVEEDPRSGVALVEVPEQHQVPYAPLVPKILHWFGGVFHIVKDWKGGNVQERRGCWLTATALFLCKPTGPQVDGRDITRCVGIEFMDELFDGSEGYLGIVPNVKDGPPQPQLALLFDSAELKRNMMQAIAAAYEFRKKTPIKITKVLSIEAKMKIDKEKDFKPHLFIMKTRNDLYGLLRGKV